MGINSRQISLILLSYLLHVTSPLYLGDYRNPKHRTVPSTRNDHLSHLGAKAQRFDLTQGRRENGKDKERNQASSTGTFINCVFKVGSRNQPEYACKHSEDVKINWTRKEGGLLMGTFSTKFHCLKRREVPGKISSSRNKVGEEKWKPMIRDKRRNVYWDDIKVVDTWSQEEDNPDVNQDVDEEDGLVDSEAQSTEDGDEISDKEGSIELIEEEEGEIEDKIRKAALRRAKGTVDLSPTYRQDDGGEGGIEKGKEVNEVEEKKDDVTDSADEEVPAPQSVDSKDETNPEERQEVTEAEEEAIDETSTKDEHDNNANESDKGGDEENADATDAPKGKVDKPEVDKADEPDSKAESGDKPVSETEIADKPDGGTETVAKPDKETGIVGKPDSGAGFEVDELLVPIQSEIDLILSSTKVPHIIALLQHIMNDLSDYVLAFFMGDLRRRLRQGRIDEKFNHKVEMLAKSNDNDTEKALVIMKHKIHQQLGKPYQLEIVKLLSQLYDDWNS